MGLAHAQTALPRFAEDIRLVIWDLDETFWDGTLTEGGITYRQDHHQLVIDLAQRGIMSAICSKNERSDVEALLKQTGLWDFFIFSTIDWSPKGSRIRLMLEQTGLRAASVLFIDDNAMNLAQAAHMCPGLNVGTPDLIAGLREADQLQGKPDPDLNRLSQYMVKERKLEALIEMGTDTIEFLRQSDVRVFIEYDVEPHIDRVIELINRTNQLNFTKKRLPDDDVAARSALLGLLSHNTTDAGLIRVRDRYGDYGSVGFYLTRRLNNTRRLEHFCFSCRTLNMYIEHWLYDFLGRPELKMDRDVLSDPVSDPVRPDWIKPAPIAAVDGPVLGMSLFFDSIFARGGCDLASLMHYFTLHAQTIVEEFNQPRNGQMFRRDHTAFLMPALTGSLTEDQLWAAASLGYDAKDFETDLLSIPPQNALYFLSFWADADIPVYRHKETGLRLPYWLVGAQNHDLIAHEDLRAAVGTTDDQRKRLDVLARDFECEGLLSTAEMTSRYGIILDHLPIDAPVVIVMANERGPLHFQNPNKGVHPHHAALNSVLRSLAGERSNVLLIDPADHIKGAEDLIDLNHFKRPVYHRMYRDVVDQLMHRNFCQTQVASNE